MRSYNENLRAMASLASVGDVCTSRMISRGSSGQALAICERHLAEVALQIYDRRTRTSDADYGASDLSLVLNFEMFIGISVQGTSFLPFPDTVQREKFVFGNPWRE
ncbi:MAG: hypothetical protein ACI9BW_004108 [Gammaproteobacteria bacterium]|jgi:hypothetical protein